MAGKGTRRRSGPKIAAPSLKETGDATVLEQGESSVEWWLSQASLDDLEAEVDRRRRTLNELHGEHVDLVRRLKVLEKKIKSLGGEAAGMTRNGARPRNRTNLVDALASVLADRTLTVMEAVEAVQLDGYRTTSPNFRIIVNQALLGNPDRFRKVARGRYTSR